MFIQREEFIQIMAEGVAAGMALHDSKVQGKSFKEVLADVTPVAEPKPTKEKKAKAKPKAKVVKKPEPPKITYEQLVKEIKALSADYIEGIEIGQKLAMSTLTAKYEVTKFSDLNPNQYGYVLEYMTEVMS